METLKSAQKPKAKPDLSILNPGVGHNGDMPEISKVLVFVGKQMQLEAEKKAVGKKIKDLNYQIVNAGIPVRSMAEGREIYEKGVDVWLAHFRVAVHIAKALGTPSSEQLNLFADPKTPGQPSQMSALEVAYEKGKMLGLLGKDPDEQAYHSNSDLWQDHRRGWDDGKAESLAFWQQNMEAENARAAKEAKDKADKATVKAAKAETKANSAKGRAEKLVRGAIEDLDTEKTVN